MTDRVGREEAFTLERQPFTELVGIRIESANGGEATARLPFGPKLLNAGGPNVPIHGGAIATLIDVAACAAVWSLPTTTRSATIGITINYVGAGILSDLVARAKLRRAGKSVASLTVEVRDSEGALVADGLVTYKIG